MSALTYAPPTDPYLQILYSDADLLVLAKQSGILSVPGRKDDLADCIQARAQSAFPGSTIVHRLDLETSGVMVLARNRPAHRHISWQFEKRQVEKTYEANVWGVLAANRGEIDAPLICDWPNRPRQIIDHENGRSARTAWTVINNQATSTRLRLTPHTGRSHQLRVHLQSIGHPILGDNLYAHPEARDGVDRLQLHALSLSLHHPTNETRMTFTSPCPF